MQELIVEMESSGGSCGYLVDRVCDALKVGKRNARMRHHLVPDALGGDMNAAARLVEAYLPGWGWRMATCCVSDDAWMFPDFNHPHHGERLKREYDEYVDWVEVTDVDLRPARNPALALVISMLKAMAHTSVVKG